MFFSDAQLFNVFIVLSTALSLCPAGVTFLDNCDPYFGLFWTNWPKTPL